MSSANLSLQFKQYLKRTPLGQFLIHSYGDWRYPHIALGWFLSKCLVPRRRVRTHNVSFTLSCVNWITHFRWYLFGKKESEICYYIDEFVKEGDIFFDIGANVGIFSIYCAKKHSNISVYSFEPEYSNLNHLKDNVFFNGLADKVTIHSVAIGDAVGLSFLNMQDMAAGAAAHTESKRLISKTEEGFSVIFREGISVVTLDAVCEQLNVVPNALKIDTDGNEMKVLTGAQRTLQDHRLRSLVLEMPPDSKNSQLCSDLLKSFGFKLKWSQDDQTRNQIWAR